MTKEQIAEKCAETIRVMTPNQVPSIVRREILTALTELEAQKDKEIRKILEGHPDSEVWGCDGLLAATMRKCRGFDNMEEVAKKYEDRYFVEKEKLAVAVDENKRLKALLTNQTA